jgi:hypothetical protein
MNIIPDISHFSIFLETKLTLHQNTEREDLTNLLRCLAQVIKLSDVEFGENPPDFIFHHQDRKIGVELTDLNPKEFHEHGHLKRAEYKTFGPNTFR